MALLEVSATHFYTYGAECGNIREIPATFRLQTSCLQNKNNAFYKTVYVAPLSAISSRRQELEWYWTREQTAAPSKGVLVGNSHPDMSNGTSVPLGDAARAVCHLCASSNSTLHTPHHCVFNIRAERGSESYAQQILSSLCPGSFGTKPPQVRYNSLLRLATPAMVLDLFCVASAL